MVSVSNLHNNMTVLAPLCLWGFWNFEIMGSAFFIDAVQDLFKNSFPLQVEILFVKNQRGVGVLN